MTAFAGCGSHTVPNANPPTTKAEPEPIRVACFQVTERTWPRLAKCQGSLFVDDSTVVGSRVAGLVAATSVDVGDRVERGQELVALDDEEFKLQLAASEASLTQARALIGLKPEDPVSKLNPQNAPPVREAKAVLDEANGRAERWQLLRSQNAVAEEELQTLLSAVKVAEARYASALNSVHSNIALVAVRTAEVDLARQHIRDAHIAAPFNGYVQARHVAAGMYVQIGTPLMTIVRVDTLRFRGSLPERMAGELQVGDAISLRVESIPDPIAAKVSRITPALDMTSRSLAFEAQVDNRDGKLRAGLFAEADVILDDQAQALVIPKSALVEFAGAEKVWIVNAGRAQEQAVRVGRRTSEWIEIIGGLKPEDTVLRTGSEGSASPVIALLEQSSDKPLQNDETQTGAQTKPVLTESNKNDSASPSQPAG